VRLATHGAALLLLASFSEQRPQSEDSKASIHGVVVSAGTGVPLPRARVTLIRTAAGIGTLAAEAANGSTPSSALPADTTDGDGKFALTNVEPGSYRIAVARNGYARQEYGQRVFGGRGKALTLVEGQSIGTITVRLTPAGSVSGVVRDPSGEPMSGRRVELLHIGYGPSGQKTLRPVGGDRTDDRGEYRVYWVTPGRYYLAVRSSAPGRSVTVLGAGSPNEIVERGYPTTYYPGTLEISQASAVEVQPGVEMDGIDVSVPEQDLFHVRGRILDSNTRLPARTASVSIVRRSSVTSPVGLTSLTPSYNPANGTFDLRGVPPGSYWVRATISSSSGDSVVPASATGLTLADFFSESILSGRRMAQAAVDVFDVDIDGLILTPSSGVSIQGRLRIEGETTLESAGDFERLQVTLRPATPETLFNPLEHRPMSVEGVFRLTNVLPGYYFVTVQSLPPDYYVKEARTGQIDALDQPMAVTGSAPAPLDIVISPGGGRIDGVVVDDDGQAVTGIEAVLVPIRQRRRIHLYRTAVTDGSGRFSLREIPPGEYRVFAWEAIESFGYFDEDFLRESEQKGTFVRVAESGRETVQVKLIPAAFPREDARRE